MQRPPWAPNSRSFPAPKIGINVTMWPWLTGDFNFHKCQFLLSYRQVLTQGFFLLLLQLHIYFLLTRQRVLGKTLFPRLCKWSHKLGYLLHFCRDLVPSFLQQRPFCDEILNLNFRLSQVLLQSRSPYHQARHCLQFQVFTFQVIGQRRLLLWKLNPVSLVRLYGNLTSIIVNFTQLCSSVVHLILSLLASLDSTANWSEQFVMSWNSTITLRPQFADREWSLLTQICKCHHPPRCRDPSDLDFILSFFSNLCYRVVVFTFANFAAARSASSSALALAAFHRTFFELAESHTT